MAEQKLQAISNDSSLEAVIIRSPLVYGPGEPGNFMRLIRLVDGLVNRGLPLPFGALRGQRSLIYVRNLVNAIVTCVGHPDAAGKIFLVSDGEDISTVELMERIAVALGRPARQIAFPLNGLRALGKLSGRAKQVNSLMASLVIDSSRIRRELGWLPPCSMADGLRETVDWYCDRKNSRSGNLSSLFMGSSFKGDLS
jgi:nucleoside-diphosphate-sugar epimerase